MWSGPTCDKCRRRNPVAFTVSPEGAWRTVVLNRWKTLCPSCFDQEAEAAKVVYEFQNLEATTWVDEAAKAAGRSRSRRKR